MLDSFLTFINQPGLDFSKQKTLLTVSGGVDSVVMAHLFHRAGFEAAVVHCNFGLRAEESVQDEVFVKELAGKYEFAFYVKHFDPKTYAKEHTVSTQMAARDLRYEWFEELRTEHNFDWIATAHHANDALETVFLNLARGTGITGLHGIAAVHSGIVRPMLFASKDQILDYANENQLLWREDRSNNSMDYKRNIIRKKIIPVLKELNPSLEKTFQVTSDKVRAADSLLTGYLEQWKKSVLTESEDQIKISISGLQQSGEPSYRLWHILNVYGFNYTQCVTITKSLKATSGKTFYSKSHELLKDRETFILRARKGDNSSVNLTIAWNEGQYELPEGYLKISRVNTNEINYTDKNPEVIWLDEGKLIFPLQVRKGKEGEVFYPFGMKGKRKKISDLLIDLKMSLYQKEKVNVLVNGNGEIIWVIGVRADDRWRLMDETKQVLRVERLSLMKEI
ncbi:tRNA lysidine(34) synthetase TilS [Dyadobacter psychrotolerans]|uniref:tRNA(Ile)-lysidine synthase n=1 Tax=Dyadobacter psychrotolerans TaxID=2541721 RepID=A0A4R5DW57_9BACT|nr:tRNA lysidine(34) synthetase TilS [Dyadobacter psychrotolerans]TDE16381.1 tRNA lysidine(34) synthetase TilS [Dyadobacter psychrotolerans]